MVSYTTMSEIMLKDLFQYAIKNIFDNYDSYENKCYIRASCHPKGMCCRYNNHFYFLNLEDGYSKDGGGYGYYLVVTSRKKQIKYPLLFPNTIIKAIEDFEKGSCDEI